MSKAILRVAGVKTTSDLQGLGKHHVDRISATNKDIDRSRSEQNITLVKPIGSYNEMFEYTVRDLKKQHEEQMTKTRASRQKTFREKINDDRADVACELMLSASPEYFEGKSREEIEDWAKTSLSFVTEKIGIEEKNILHAVVHLDESTPHLHVVAVPLVEKYDGRKKENVLAISRKHFIKTREDMAKVQTDYVEFMNGRGFELERGMEKSGAKHLDVARYKIKATGEQLEQVTAELHKATAAKEQAEKEKQLLEKRLAELQERVQSVEKDVESVERVFTHRLTLNDDLEGIESRTEPVKRIFGNKDKEEEVRLPKKDFKRLLELADRGVGAELVVTAEKEKGAVVKRQHGELVQKHNDLVGKYNELLSSSKTMKTQNKELQADLKLSNRKVTRLSDFVVSEDLGEQFNEWNKKFEKQQQRQQNRRDFGMER